MVLATTVVCGASLFTSCKKDEDNNLNLEEKIIGKWMTADMNGKPLPSNEKTVYTFVSATKATVSTAITTHPEVGTHWNDKLDADVTIDGNKITLTDHPDEHTMVVEEYTVTAISGTEFTANHKVIVTKDGIVVNNDEHVLRLAKQTTDYKQAILGTWQGHCTSEGSVFDDGQEHRWEYRTDGSYVYYRQEGQAWVPYGDDFAEYFVDGNLLCTRWRNSGEQTENREWWEITVDGPCMHWTALRQNPDGTTFTATFSMTKVN